VCGWEANGGFLTGSDIERNGRVLTALATRDALLPILSVLIGAGDEGLIARFARLPERFSRSALLRDFPRAAALEMLAAVSADRERLAGFFPGFGAIAQLDCTDGLRITFASGEVAHLRPSGNADELRIYAVADTQERADEIAAMGVAEPDGILRSMERAAR
jgi:phosphomannomutase